MPLSKITAIASAIALAAVLSATALAQTPTEIVVDPAIATMTNEQLVEARQDAMKEDGGILRNAASLTGDEAVAAATTLLQNFTNFPALFREGSLVADSKALPAIWEHWDDFNAILTEGQTASKTMLAAAISGDTAAYTEAINVIGQTCGKCHQSYRGR